MWRIIRWLRLPGLLLAGAAVAGYIERGPLEEAVRKYAQDLTAVRNRIRNHLPPEARHAIQADPNLILFSLDPDYGPNASPTANQLRGWPVLGQITVSDAAQRKQLLTKLEGSLNRWDGLHGTQCFAPRHALRATEGGQTFELLICFECGWIYYYPTSGKEDQLTLWAKPGLFDELLIAAQVPRNPPPARWGGVKK